MALEFTVGSTVTLDESANPQNLTSTPNPAGDADDNDTSPGSLPLPFVTRLTTSVANGGLGAGTPTTAALSGYTGSGTGSNAFTVSATSGGAITDVGWVGANGLPLDAVNSGLVTLNDTQIFLYTDTSNNNILLGRAGVGGPIVFAAYIEQTAVSGGITGKIWMTLYQPLKHPLTTNADDAVDLTGKVFIGATQNTEFSLKDAPSGQNLFIMYTTENPTVDSNGRITNVSLIATGKEPLNQSEGGNLSSGDTVNTSQAGGPTTFGTNNQMVTEQEGIRYTFVTGARQDFTVPNLDQNEADLEAHIDFTAFFGTRTAQFDVVQLQSGKSAQVRITATSSTFVNGVGDADSNHANESGAGFIDGYADDSGVLITSVEVTNTATGAMVASATGTTTTPVNGIVFTQIGGSFLITGVLAGQTVKYTTGSDHHRVLIENGAALDARGNTHADFDIGGFKVVETAMSRVEIGSKMIFEDDGPSVTVAQVAAADQLLVDETNLAQDASADYANNFSNTANHGADGAGTVTNSYALGISSEGVDSQLDDVDTGSSVLLYLEGTPGQVVGRAGSASGAIVFTVSVNQTSGLVTLDQQRAVVHPNATNPDDAVSPVGTNLITLTRTATITDSEGDTNSGNAVIDITAALFFKDDGPSANGSPVTGTVDEDGGLAGGNPGGPGDSASTNVSSGNVATIFSPGADGLGSYGLSADTTGLATNLKSQGGTVVYDVASNVLTAYVETNGTNGFQNGADRPVYTLSLNSATGEYLFTLLDQLDHPGTDDPATAGTQIRFEDEIALNLGSILQVTDKDLDTVTAAADRLVITVDDDSPDPFTPTDASVDNTGSDSDTQSLGTTDTFGADSPGSARFVDNNPNDNYLYATGTSTKLTSGGQNIVLSWSADGTTLTAKTETSQLTVFTATLNAEQYTITFSRPLDDGAVPTNLLGAAPVRSGNPLYNLIDNVAGTDLDLLFSGANTSGQTTVNVSTNGAGTGNQTMNPGEMLRIDFTKDAALAGSPNGSDFVMGTHKNVHDFAFLVSQNTPTGTNSIGTVLLQAYDADDDKVLSNDPQDTLDIISTVEYTGVLQGQTTVTTTVIYANGVSTNVVDSNGNTVRAIGVDTDSNGSLDSVVVTGLNEGKSGDGTGGDDPMITVDTASGFERIEMTNYAGRTVNGQVLGGTDFDIAPAGVFQGTPGQTLSFDIAVQTSDYDGDRTDVELIGVTVNPLPLG